jgi:uncharacterized protein
VAGVLDRLDAGAVRRWARDALDRLGSHRDEIDGLNVYPVPDGDTGTNLYLTVESAVAAVEQVPDGDDLPRVADALATGALHGARGSSGVILSQLLRGWADGLREHPDGGGRAVRAALTRAADSAYAAVSRPSEGTMLTVARAAAEGAGRGGSNLRDVVSSALGAARSALERTPGQLDALGRAGVVDAGGRGLLLVLESLAGTVTGRRNARGWGVGDGLSEPGSDHPITAAADERAGEPGPGDAGSSNPAPFEVMYLVDAPQEAVGPLRKRLERLGDSVVVVGGPSAATATWKVHIHTADVTGVLTAGADAGPLRQVRVASVQAAPGSAMPDVRTTADGRPAPTAPPEDQVSVVAVTSGAGPARLLAAAGALVVVRSAAEVTPAELLLAVRDAAAGAVVVLPDDADAAAAADVVAAEAGSRVAVLPRCAPPQALAALAVHHPADPLADVVERMSAAASATRHGAVRITESPLATPVGSCRPGDAVGLAGGEVVSVGPDALAVARAVTDRLLGPGGELLTVLAGADPVAAELSRALCTGVGEGRPDLEVHALDGGAEGSRDGALLLLGVE